MHSSIEKNDKTEFKQNYSHRDIITRICFVRVSSHPMGFDTNWIPFFLNISDHKTKLAGINSFLQSKSGDHGCQTNSLSVLRSHKPISITELHANSNKIKLNRLAAIFRHLFRSKRKLRAVAK